MERIISLLGIPVLIALAWLISTDRKKFPWRIVLWGVALQFIFCVLVIGVPVLGFDGPLRFVFVAANDAIQLPTFSGDGHRLAFCSDATDLVSGGPDAPNLFTWTG